VFGGNWKRVWLRCDFENRGFLVWLEVDLGGFDFGALS